MPSTPLSICQSTSFASAVEVDAPPMRIARYTLRGEWMATGVSDPGMTSGRLIRIARVRAGRLFQRGAGISDIPMDLGDQRVDRIELRLVAEMRREPDRTRRS